MSQNVAELNDALDKLENALNRYVDRKISRLERERAFLLQVRDSQTISRVNARSRNLDSIKGIAYARLSLR